MTGNFSMDTLVLGRSKGMVAGCRLLVEDGSGLRMIEAIGDGVRVNRAVSGIRNGQTKPKKHI